MGTSGAGPFENDDALDFLDELEDSSPPERREKVESAMGRVIRSTDYIEAPVMAEAIAAAVVVAGSDDPECIAGERHVPRWLDEEPLDVDDRLEELATQALHRALRPDDNEWWELWDEARATDELTQRLSKFLDALGD
ncbi:DUF4259 domain-containing protein [Pedococcus sp. 5OH_020]|jgi:Domain of unknown function (DUF4259)|uniref:DUF4259 domain-containing protein n=1 Tax=Pedococcus sp. 5OH_020 TaxID=2989814 RepID=UPI0022EA065F|nr:DUF4259 domain-containing protein [Pedococcus sp. 5OH_020]